MSASGTSLFAVTPRAFQVWGRLVIGGGFALVLLFLLYLTWKGLDALLFVPALLLGAPGVWYLFRHPLVNLGVVLAGFILVVGYTEGLNVLEVLYGLYALGFLAHWFGTRLFLYRERIVETPEDRAMMLFLVGMTLTIPLALLHGALPGAIMSEWVALALLAMYFPVKEALRRYPAAPKLVLGMLLWIGLFIAVRNILTYRAALSSAEHAWQIARGRIYMNDNLLMILSVVSLGLLVFTRRWRSLLPMLGVTLLIFGGLILTQSRGNWVAFLLGAFAMFVVIERPMKRRMLVLSVSGMAAVLSVALVFFGEYVTLIFAGLLDRFASLQTAATQDVSLTNRWRETAAAWEHIVRNPILGRGMGVPYVFFDLAHMATDKDSFVHNGYVSLWYRFGLWGLLLMLFLWVRMVWRGFQAFRVKEADLWTRACGLGALSALVALTLTCITANPFFLKDSTFIFGVLLGMAAGAFDRSRNPEGFLPAPSPR